MQLPPHGDLKNGALRKGGRSVASGIVVRRTIGVKMQEQRVPLKGSGDLFYL